VSQAEPFTLGMKGRSAPGVQVVRDGSGFASQIKRVYDVRDYMTCDGVSNATTSMSAVLTAIGSTNATIIVPPGQQCLLSSVSFPANVTLDFTYGSIKVVTGQTVTILGPIMAGRQQIFFNALATQGTVVFTNTT